MSDRPSAETGSDNVLPAPDIVDFGAVAAAGAAATDVAPAALAIHTPMPAPRPARKPGRREGDVTAAPEDEPEAGTANRAGEGDAAVAGPASAWSAPAHEPVLLAAAPGAAAGAAPALAAAPDRSDDTPSILAALPPLGEWLPYVLGGLSVVAVSGSSPTSTPPSPPPPPPPPAAGFGISGTVVAGPLVSTHQLSVAAYRADGTVLAQARIQVDGSFSLLIDEAYAGLVTLRVEDAAPDGDYRDEGTGQVVDLTADLRALVVANGTDDLVAHITALTEMLAQVLGMAPGDGGSAAVVPAGVSPEALRAAEVALADAFGLPDAPGGLAGASVVPTIDAQGQPNPAANAYGQVLAAVSGLSVTTGDSLAEVAATLAQALRAGGLPEALVIDLMGGGVVAQADAAVLGAGLGLSAGQEQAVAQAWQVVFSAADPSAPQPGVDDFAALGIDAVDTASEAALLGSALRLGGGGADTVAELSRLAAAVERLDAMLQGESATVTVADLALLGIEVTEARLPVAVAALSRLGSTGDAPDSVQQIAQALAPTLQDSTAPSVTLDASARTDAGRLTSVAHGGRTRDTTLELGGTVADAVGVHAVQVLDGNTVLGTATVADGRWHFTTSALAAGTHNLSVRAVDLAGNAANAGPLTVTVDPAALTVSGLSGTVAVPENSAFTATPSAADAIGSLTWTKEGADAALFEIDAATGALRLSGRNAEAPTDADGNSRYQVTVRATDADGATASHAVTVVVGDVDEFDVTALADIDPTIDFVLEGSGPGQTIGLTARARDLDASDNTVTYSLAYDGDGQFTIDPLSGVVTTTGQAISRESEPFSTIVVRATGSDGSVIESNFTIPIGDVDEYDVSPLFDMDGDAGGSVTENVPVGTAVGITALARDVDATTNAVTYSLSDNPDGLFRIDADGVVRTAAAIDREVHGATRTVEVTATSADGSTSRQAFTISIGDVGFDRIGGFPQGFDPLDPDATAIGLDEMTAAQLDLSVFGDTPHGQLHWTVEFAWTANPIDLSLDPDTGRLSLAPQDYETLVAQRAAAGETFDGTVGGLLRVQDDGGQSQLAMVVFRLRDVDEHPAIGVDADATANGVFENLAAGTAVGITLAAVDADGQGSVDTGATFRLVGDGDTNLFTIDDAGVVRTTRRLDRETDGASRTITVETRGSDGLVTRADHTIAIGDVRIDEGVVLPPPAVENVGFWVTPSLVGTTDEAVTWSIEGADAFVVHADDTTTGAVRLIYPDGMQGRPLVGILPQDYEDPQDADGDNLYEVTLVATGPSGWVERQTLRIEVTDAAAEPVSAPFDADTSDNVVLDNNLPGGRTSVGITVQAVDQDPTNNTVTYDFAPNGNADGLFAIDQGTGVVTTSDVSIDIDAHGAERTITVRATSSDGSWVDQSFNVEIVRNDHQVTILGDADTDADIVLESFVEFIPVGITVQAKDTDTSHNAVTYRLTNDFDGLFTIDPISGVVTTTDRTIDFEARGATASIEVEARSADGSTATQSFDITILDLPHAITGLEMTDIEVSPGTTVQGFEVDEFTGQGTDQVGVFLGTVTLDEVNFDDAPEGWYWSQAQQDDFESFGVDSQTGVLTFYRSDFENPTDVGGIDNAANNVFVTTIEAKDASGTVMTSQRVTVVQRDVGFGIVAQPGADPSQPITVDLDEGLDGQVALQVIGDVPEGALEWSIDFAWTQEPFQLGVDGGVASLPAQDYETLRDSGVWFIDLSDANNPSALQIPFDAFDYTVGASVTVRDQAGNTGTTMVQFAIRDVPEIADPGDFDQPVENAAWSLDMNLSDTPAGQVQWSIGSAIDDGADGSLFAIDPESGVLTLREPLDAEAEGTGVYRVTAVATAANGASGRYTVSVEPGNVPLVIDGSDGTVYLVEEGAESRVVNDFDLSATSDLASGSPRWEIVQRTDDDSSRFRVDGNGVVTFAVGMSTAASNDDHDGIYTAILRVSDDAGQQDEQLVRVGFVGPPDLAINLASGDINNLSVVENTPDAVVLQAELISTGDMGVVTWSLADGLDRGEFAINPTDGTLYLREQDHEGGQTTFRVVVEGHDGRGHSVQQQINVNVTDAPLEIVTSQRTYHVDEDAPLTIEVSTDRGITDLDWSLSGADASLFSWAFDSGGGRILSFAPQDFENPTDNGGVNPDGSYTVTLTAYGSSELTATRTITVIVDDVDETSGAAELAGAAEWFSGPPVDLDPFHVAPPPTFG